MNRITCTRKDMSKKKTGLDIKHRNKFDYKKLGISEYYKNEIFKRTKV